MHFNDGSSTLLCHCSWTFILSRSWTAKKSTPPTILLVEWIFLAVHERTFYGPLWTKLLAKNLFLVVHERLNDIVQQHAFIPRCWMYPNLLADYLLWTEVLPGPLFFCRPAKFNGPLKKSVISGLLIVFIIYVTTHFIHDHIHLLSGQELGMGLIQLGMEGQEEWISWPILSFIRPLSTYSKLYQTFPKLYKPNLRWLF